MQAAIAALARGEVIVLPTETLYGLTADPTHPQAMARLLRMKARPAEKGFILLIKDQEQLASLTLPPSPLALELMARFWPGPLTLVLPARSDLSPLITGQTGHVAVRLSPAPQVRALLEQWQRPLISTSANRTGQPTPHNAEAIRRIWPEENLLVLEGTIHPHALPSTVVQVDKDQARLLREGAISRESLHNITPLS